MHWLPRAFAASLLLSVCVFAAAPQFPALSGRVVDQAGLLSASGRAWLEQRLAEHERATSDQVVVAIVSSLQGYPIEDYGVQLARRWGIGQAKKNNGVVLLIAPKERTVRFEVGYGLEGKLTDALSHSIIENEILPHFRRGDYETGIIRGTSAVLAGLNDAYIAPEPKRTRTPPTKFDDLWLQVIFIMLVLLFLGTRLARFGAAALGGLATGHFSKLFGAPLLLAVGLGGVVFALIALIALKTARRRRLPLDGGWGPGGWGHRGSGWGGGGWGGGGFSGGGGSFGGGGASGRW